ncbi:hypothetical protein JST97_03750 [bacterium]|nr:hypothetical protein [bacterium]
MKMWQQILLCTCFVSPVQAQEGFSPTLPFGTKNTSVQAGDIHGGGFSPTQPFRDNQHPAHESNPHQDQRYNYARGYNYYYGYGYYNGYGRSYNGQVTMPTSNGGPPGYDAPLPSHAPPGY